MRMNGEGLRAIAILVVRAIIHGDAGEAGDWDCSWFNCSCVTQHSGETSIERFSPPRFISKFIVENNTEDII